MSAASVPRSRTASSHRRSTSIRAARSCTPRSARCRTRAAITSCRACPRSYGAPIASSRATLQGGASTRAHGRRAHRGVGARAPTRRNPRPTSSVISSLHRPVPTMTTNARLLRRTCAFERQDVGSYGSYDRLPPPKHLPLEPGSRRATAFRPPQTVAMAAFGASRSGIDRGERASAPACGWPLQAGGQVKRDSVGGSVRWLSLPGSAFLGACRCHAGRFCRCL